MKKSASTPLINRLFHRPFAYGAAGMLVGSFIFIFIHGGYTWMSDQDNMISIAKIVSHDVKSSLIFQDYEETEKSLLSLKATPSILGVKVLTEDGQVLASFGVTERTNFTGQREIASTGESMHYGWDHISFEYPVVDETTSLPLAKLYFERSMMPFWWSNLSFAGIVFGLFLVAMWFTYLWAKRTYNAVSGPIYGIIETSNQIAETDNFTLRASQKTERNSIEELLKLTDAFDGMLGQIQKRNQIVKETQSQLIQSGKLAALGEMSSGVAHELNNPLHFINGFNNRIKAIFQKNESVRYEQVENYVTRIAENCERMRKIIQHFRDFSRQTEEKLDPIYVNEVVYRSFILLTEQLRLRQIAVENVMAPSNPMILGNINRLEQVIVNLITNARDALEGLEHAKITVATRVEGDKAFIEVSDNGPGIPEEIREKIFNPFFTTKEVGKGTGLGLSISHSIIKEHKGTIQCVSEIGKGTLFKMTFDLHQEAS